MWYSVLHRQMSQVIGRQIGELGGRKNEQVGGRSYLCGCILGLRNDGPCDKSLFRTGLSDGVLAV